MDEYPLVILQRTGHVDYFCELIGRAERGEAFTITRDEKPVAVVVGIAEYEDMKKLLDGFHAADRERRMSDRAEGGRA